jgi:hypothetical protein
VLAAWRVVAVPQPSDQLLQHDDHSIHKAGVVLCMQWRCAHRFICQGRHTLQVPQELTDKLVAACHDRMFKTSEECITSVVAEGYSASAIIEQLFEKVMEAKELSDPQKAFAVAAFAEADKHLVDGADGILQLHYIASVLQQLYNGLQA